MMGTEGQADGRTDGPTDTGDDNNPSVEEAVGQKWIEIAWLNLVYTHASWTNGSVYCLMALYKNVVSPLLTH